MNSPRNIPPRSPWRWSPIAWTLLALAAGGACGDGGPALPDDGGGGQSDAGGFVVVNGGGPVASAKYCDDGNACTVDSVEGDTCRFDAVADGTICEDGDLCTLGIGASRDSAAPALAPPARSRCWGASTTSPANTSRWRRVDS